MVERKTAAEHSMEFVCIDNLVPSDHILRQVQKYIDFILYEIVWNLYIV